MRRSRIEFTFALFAAAVVAGIVVLVGVANTPPRFIARAAFVVDWKAMPTVPKDEQAEKIRANWRTLITAEVTGLPQSEQEISEVLNHANGFDGGQTDKSAVISKLARWLHVTLANQTNDCDCFIVELKDNDPRMAQTAIEWVMQGMVSKLKVEARTGGGVAALRSNANVEDVVQKKADLKAEKQRLAEMYTLPFPGEVRERINHIDAELSQLEFQHFEAGLGLLANLGGILSNDQIKIVEQPHVEERHTGYGLCVIFAAVCLGGLVGMAAFVGAKIVRALASSRGQVGPPVIPPGFKAPTSVTPPITKAPPASLPSIIRPDEGAKPPPLPPPIIR